jgi:hypothetical protein
MRDDTLTLRGATVRTLPRRNRTWTKGRTCAQEGCVTRISVYNRAKYCWVHEPVRYYVARGRKKKPQAA